jgi:hypothetical protein
MRRSFKVCSAIGLLAGIGAILMLWLSSSKSAQLPNGLRMELLSVTKGTDVFLDGSPLERALGDILPSKGVHLGAFHLNRPRPTRSWEEAPLTAWVSLQGPGLVQSDFTSRRAGLRVIAASKSGREIENPPGLPMRLSVTEVLLSIPLRAFPRDARTIQLRILPPEYTDEIEQTLLPGPLRERRLVQDRAAERPWVQFEFSNPIHQPVEHWHPSALPITNQIDDLTIVLTELHPGRSKSFRSLISPQIGPADLSFRLSSRNWQIPECIIRDEESNSFSHTSMRLLRDRSPPVEFKGQFEYSLEPDRTWKIQAKLIRAPQFPFNSPGSPPLRLTDFPDYERMTAEVVAHGPEVRMTNSLGDAYFCYLAGPEVYVRKETGLDLPYVVLIDAANENMAAVSFDRGVSWAGRPNERKLQRWSMGSSAPASTNLTLHFAAPKVVTTVFYAKPW